MKIQNPRNRIGINVDHLNIVYHVIKSFMSEHEITFNEAVEIYKLAQKEQNRLSYIENGDCLDENLYGIGTALENLKKQ